MGAGWPINKIKALMYSLAYEIDAGIRKEFDKKNKEDGINHYEVFTGNLESDDIGDLLSALDFIEDYLYKKNLTRWDLRQHYDTSNVELENYYKGV